MFAYPNPYEQFLPTTPSLPESIKNKILDINGESLFMAIRLDNHKLIPILTAAYDDLYDRTGSRSIPLFDRYTDGAIDGMESKFIPHIDTPENRKEIIMNKIFQDKFFFPDVIDEDEKERAKKFSNYMYYYGREVGSLYKAWTIVLKNPKYFVDDFKEYESNLITKREANNGAFKSLEDIFYDTSLIDDCIEILRKTDPPAIDWKNNFIGHPKSLIDVWISELLRAKPPIVKNVNNKDLAILLNNKFPGLNISDKTLYGHSIRAERHRIEIKTMVSNITRIQEI